MAFTLQTPWRKFNQATANVSGGLTADIDTPVLAYDGTYTTEISAAGGASAQNPNNRPATAVRIPMEASNILFMFAVADTEDDGCMATLWTWDANGPAWNTVNFTVIQAGATVLNYDYANPDTALTDFFLADTVTISPDNARGATVEVDNTADGIALVHLDFYGTEWMFMDYDFDAYGGTAGTDCITYYKFL